MQLLHHGNSFLKKGKSESQGQNNGDNKGQKSCLATAKAHIEVSCETQWRSVPQSLHHRRPVHLILGSKGHVIAQDNFKGWKETLELSISVQGGLKPSDIHPHSKQQ